jgi:DNA-binding Lrp family transcriptional regulator
MALDRKDERIIEVLRKDSRMPVRDIAKKTGIRPSTVHARIRRLIDDGFIEKFTIKTNNKGLGENFTVFILVSADKNIDDSAFSSAAVKEVFGITGESDLLIKCRFKDIAEFNEFILKFRKVQNVNRTITMVATTTIKEEI